MPLATLPASVTRDEASSGFNTLGGTFTLPTSGAGAVGVGDWVYLVWSNITNTGDTATTLTYTFPGWQNVAPARVIGSMVVSIWRRERLSTDGGYTLSINSGRLWRATMFWVKDVPADLTPTIGVRKAREDAPVEDQTNTAPGTTVEADDLVVSVSIERTTATETGAPAITGADLFAHAPATSGNTVQHTLATRYAEENGTSPDVVFAYQNVHAVNGVAVQIRFQSEDVATTPPSDVTWVGAASRGSFSSGNTATGGTVSAPAGVQADDWLYLLLETIVDGGDVVGTVGVGVQSGWELVEPEAHTGTMGHRLWRRKYVSGSTTYSVSIQPSSGNAGRYWTGMIFAVRGATDTHPRSVRTNRSGSTTQNTAPAISGVQGPGLTVVWSAERTLATEATSPTVSGATLRHYQAQSGDNTLTAVVASADVASGATATSAATVTYPNSHATNGVAQAIYFPSTGSGGTPPPDPSYAQKVEVVQGGVALAAKIEKYDDGGLIPVSNIAYKSGTFTLDDLLADSPFFVGHRGAGGNWPEHTYRSYTGAVMWGLKAIEISVQRTSDGVLVCHHDTDTIRMTGVANVIKNVTWATLQALMNTAAETDNPTQPRWPIPLLDDVLDKYAATHVIFIEPKDSHSTNAQLFADVRAKVKTYANWADHFVFKTYINNPELGTWKADGFTTWGYVLDESSHWTNLTALIGSSNVDLVGVRRTYTDTQIQLVCDTARTAGKRVMMWEIRDGVDYERALAFGCSGMMTSNVRRVLPKFPTPTPPPEEPPPPTQPVRRVAFDHPWRSSAMQNTSIGSDAQYEASTDARTAHFLSAASMSIGVGVNWDRWSFTKVQAKATDPLVEIVNASTGAVIATIRCPRNIEASGGTDRHVGINQPDGYSFHECYKFNWVTLPPSNYNPNVVSGRISTTYHNLNDLRGDGLARGSRASGISFLTGLITMAEVRGLVIEHTLALGVPARMMKPTPLTEGINGDGQRTNFSTTSVHYLAQVWPARLRDNQVGVNVYTGQIAMGSLFAIPPTINLDTLSLSPIGRAVGRALQDYGAHILVQAGVVALFVEPPVQPSAGLPADIQAAVTQLKTDWANVLYPRMRRIKNNLPGALTNNSPNSMALVSGGGTRRRPPLPPLAEGEI